MFGHPERSEGSQNAIRNLILTRNAFIRKPQKTRTPQKAIPNREIPDTARPLDGAGPVRVDIARYDEVRCRPPEPSGESCVRRRDVLYDVQHQTCRTQPYPGLHKRLVHAARRRENCGPYLQTFEYQAGGDDPG